MKQFNYITQSLKRFFFHQRLPPSLVCLCVLFITDLNHLFGSPCLCAHWAACLRLVASSNHMDLSAVQCRRLGYFKRIAAITQSKSLQRLSFRYTMCSVHLHWAISVGRSPPLIRQRQRLVRVSCRAIAAAVTIATV